MRSPFLLVAGGAAVAAAAILTRPPAPAPSSRVRVALTSAKDSPRPRPSVKARTNILPGDYVGPEACNGCHDDRYEQWRSHPHSRMNARATDETVRGDFSGKRVQVPQGEAIFANENGKRTMTLIRGEKVVRSYVITRTVGSRFMQFYIGRQVVGPEPAGDPIYVDEVKLPYGYWFKLARWLPVSYFDPVGAETMPDGTPAFDPFDHPRNHRYASNCMLCHNTYPYVYRLALPDALHGIPGDDGHVDLPALTAAISASMDLSGTKPIRERLDPDRDLVTLGVSCESCHFGGREHAKEDGESPLLPVSPILQLAPRAGAKPTGKMDDVYSVNLVCAQCHRATITLYPNGCGTWNSREALDMLGGACKGAIKCTDCHDPHKPGGPEASPGHPAAQTNACTKCHAQYGDDAAAAKHARHPVGAKVSCLDCHMPRITQGLEEVVRTHRISSPTDATMLATGSWNSCNLCHLDRTIAWTVDELAKWGKKIVPDDRWKKHYGDDLSKPVGVAWLEGVDPSMRLVATQAWSRSPLGKEGLPRILAALDDPVAVNRVFAMFAVERVTGTRLSIEDYDVIQPPAVRRKSIDRLLDRLCEKRSPGGR